MHHLVRNSKVRLTILLFFIYLTALVQFLIWRSVGVLLFSVGFSVLCDLLFTLARKKRLFIPHAAVVTGFIIALLADPNGAWYFVVIAAAIAMAAKNFIRVSGRHIFNPAAIGLLVAGMLTNQYVTWWAVSFQNVQELNFNNLAMFLILASPVVVSAYGVRRAYAVVSFLVSYAVLSHLFTFAFSVPSLVSRLFDAMTVFFSVVMVPEPMTSPIHPRRQVWYGITIALVANLLAYPPILDAISARWFMPDLLLPALLFGNALFFRR